MKTTHIAWCDSTINFWSGCTKVSPGCAHCYAEARDKRHLIEAQDHWGQGAPRLKHKGAVKAALALNRQPWICDECGLATSDKPESDWPCEDCRCKTFHRRRIFSLSLGDWLDAEVPIEWLAEMLDTIRQCPDVTWILCTKRPELFFDRVNQAINCNLGNDYLNFLANWTNGDVIPKNIILLTSVENQATADQRIPELLKIPAACCGLSVEPMLGPIDLSYYTGWRADHAKRGLTGPLGDALGRLTDVPGIDWAIFGGESGDQARPCNVQWIRDGLKQCQAAGVPVFVKQIGRDPQWSDQDMAERWYEKLSHPKGGDPAEWPADLRIRQFPKL